MKSPIKDIWPLPLRKLNAVLLRSISEEDFWILRRLVRNRAAKNSLNAHHSRSIARRLLLRRKGRKPYPELKYNQPDLYFSTFQSNPILDTFFPRRKQEWIAPINRKSKVHFELREFSFVDKPNETMHQLNEIARAESFARAARADFCDAQVLDIGPYVVWGLMSDHMAPFISGGKISVPTQKVIEAVRLRDFMKMREFKGLKDQRDVWAFQLRERNRGVPTATLPQAIGFSKVADEFVATVNEWLGALPQPFELRPEAKPRINRIVTEILDNAERHSRPKSTAGEWYIAGFMARRETQDTNGQIREWHDCHVSIVNLGRTIAEAMFNSDREDIRKDMMKYVNKHRLERSRSKETLATLYAMQDGVSSLPVGAGGQGMMEMVELTNQLGRTDDSARWPVITVISGRSCVRFSDRYRSCDRLQNRSREQRNEIERGIKRVQTFNEEKRFDFPPDSRYVFDLDFGFPGTIVALRFTLDHEALEPSGDGGN